MQNDSFPSKVARRCEMFDCYFKGSRVGGKTRCGGCDISEDDWESYKNVINANTKGSFFYCLVEREFVGEKNQKIKNYLVKYYTASGETKTLQELRTCQEF